MRRLVLAALVLAVVFPSVAAAQTTQVTVTRFDDPASGRLSTRTAARCARRWTGSTLTSRSCCRRRRRTTSSTSGLGIGRGVQRGRSSDPQAGWPRSGSPHRRPQSYVVSVGTSFTATMRNVRITGGRNDESGGGIEVNATGTSEPARQRGRRQQCGRAAAASGAPGRSTSSARPVAGNATTGDGSTDPGRGGGVFVVGAGTLRNSTVSGNTATSGGGVYTSGPLTLQSATVASNTGGGLHDLEGESVMRSTLVAGNQGAACSGQPGGGAEEYNLADDASCGLDGPGDRVAARADRAARRQRRSHEDARALHGEPGDRRSARRLPPHRPAAGGQDEPVRHRGVRGQHPGRISAATAAGRRPPGAGGRQGRQPAAEDRHGQDQAPALARARSSCSRRASRSRSARPWTRARAASRSVDPRGRAAETATFYDGIFKVSAGRARITNLTLVEELPLPEGQGERGGQEEVAQAVG